MTTYAYETVSSSDDPRIVDYVALTDVDLRRRKEPAEGLFMAEGERVIRRALDAGFGLRSLLLEDKWLPALQDVLEQTGAPVYLATRPVLEEITGFDVHRGALAAMSRRPLPSVDEVLSTASRIAVLEDINDHTNIGAIFRAAAGLGLDAVLLSPRCADPLYRRSVRVSMGAVFAVPWTRLARWPGGLDVLVEAGFTALALSPDPDATPIGEVATAARGRCALLLGAEGPGLSRRALERADMRVRIPMAHGVDSLNVGAAAAVAFYALNADRGRDGPGQSRR